jgi:uncharacterized protein (UPF0261 family)
MPAIGNAALSLMARPHSRSGTAGLDLCVNEVTELLVHGVFVAMNH